MYLENLIFGLALEALYCDSRHAWLQNYADEPELWTMPRKQWLWAFRQACDEFAAESGPDGTLLIEWDGEREQRPMLH